MSEPLAFVWCCAAGHDVVVSEATMRQAMVEPTCVIKVFGQLCGQRLVRKLRPFPAADTTEAP